VLITKLLPTVEAILPLSCEQLAGYILENLNAEAVVHGHGENAYTKHQRNYLSDIEETYKNHDVTDHFTFAWRWLVGRGYLAEVPSPLQEGWYRLTAAGRAIKNHHELEAPRVPREVNPGEPPNFRVIAEPGLAKHLAVLWEEAAMGYNGQAYLSTVIMLGSLLEGVLLAKCLQNDAAARAAAHAPRDHGQVKPYNRWTLNDFIAVAEDNQWIHRTRNDFADTLRDYRNMVHPHNAFARGYFVDRPVAAICWEVVRATLGDLEINV
jgi:hypothetical protein